MKTEPKYYVFDKDRKELVEVASENDNYQMNNDANKYPFLKTNPFLYNPETAPLVVYSIEDFSITVKKRELVFGDVIRDPNIPLAKRKRIIKKAFKTWKKSYNKEKKLTFSEGDKIVDVLGEVSVLKFSWKYKLILGLSFCLTVLLSRIESLLWEKFSLTGFGNYLHQLLSQMFSGRSWLRGVGNLTVYTLLFAILFVLIANMISKEYLRNYRLTETFLSVSEKNIDRSFKKRWRQARKYYLRALKNIRKVPPLAIGAVQEGQVNIQLFREACQVLIDRAYKYKKAKPFISAFKFILLSLGVLGTGTILAFTFYEMILSLFR